VHGAKKRQDDEKKKNKMILVTGGTGLVGSHLLLSLVSKGLHVKALKRKNSDIEGVRKLFRWYSLREEELPGKIEWVEGDILDYYSLEAILKDVEIIYHCAAVISFDRRYRSNVIHNNVDGTENLVNAALECGVQRFCHVSSVAALGNNSDGSPVTEESSWIPSGKNSGYSESKFYSEAEVWRGIEEGMDAVIVHPSIIIGPGNWSNGSCRFFPTIYRGLRFYTSGETGYVDVRDVADAIVMLTEEENFNKAKNQKYLLSAENLGYKEFFTMIADALQKPGPSRRATGFMLQTASKAASFWSLFSGKDPTISQETISAAIRKNRYDGSKITKQFDFRYRTVEQAVRHTAACFLGEINH
jgi:dihydroflavonol-4-reductase